MYIPGAFPIYTKHPHFYAGSLLKPVLITGTRPSYFMGPSWRPTKNPQKYFEMPTPVPEVLIHGKSSRCCVILRDKYMDCKNVCSFREVTTTCQSKVIFIPVLFFKKKTLPNINDLLPSRKEVLKQSSLNKQGHGWIQERAGMSREVYGFQNRVLCHLRALST